MLKELIELGLTEDKAKEWLLRHGWLGADGLDTHTIIVTCDTLSQATVFFDWLERNSDDIEGAEYALFDTENHLVRLTDEIENINEMIARQITDKLQSINMGIASKMSK